MDHSGYFTKPIPAYTLTVLLDDDNAGTFTCVDNKDTTFTVTFTPNIGYKFISVHLEGREDVYYRTNPCVVKLPNYGDFIATINTANEGQSEKEYDKNTELEEEEITSDKVTLDRASGWLNHPNLDLYTIYTPTEAQLKALASYLYTDDFITAFYKVVDNLLVDISFMDLFINFMSLPCSISGQNVGTVRLGWVTPKSGGNPISMNYVTQNAVEVDCGILSIEPVYGNHLDYECDIKIFLPYIGYQSLNPSDVIGTTMQVIYTIDLLTGSCVAAIIIDGSVKYQFTGDCGYKMSLTDSGTSAIPLKGISTAISVAGSAVSSVSDGGGSVLDTIGSGLNSARADATRGGQMSGNSGCMGAQTPHIIMTYPNLSLPKNFGHLKGYPSNGYTFLSTITGYTKVSEIHLEGFECTSDELAEIEELLKDGVYL